jgi:LSD1 subclass zinc finger protein
MTDASFNEDHEKISNEFNCTGCGAVLQFKPGTANLTCTYCGAENEIEQIPENIEEIDYEKFMAEQFAKEEKIEVVAVKCDACGVSITLDPNVTSDQCPYCASSIVVESGSTSSILKPKSMVPFAIDRNKAAESFRSWIKGLWFAPSNLKKANLSYDKINGIYTPYWTYDTNTDSWYTGQRGTHYYVTETYTTEEDGQTVTKTREVQKTSWTFASGQVQNVFDDVLVIASHSLPKKYTTSLEPWHLKDLVPYNDKFLSGFRTESYQVEVNDGLEEAKEIMDPTIRQTIRHDIGGDEQRIFTVNTTYSDITFKHILLPIWISSYRYKDKVYRFLINGQTGEVQGERPYSALKIFFAALLVIAIIIAIVVISNN